MLNTPTILNLAVSSLGLVSISTVFLYIKLQKTRQILKDEHTTSLFTGPLTGGIFIHNLETGDSHFDQPLMNLLDLYNIENTDTDNNFSLIINKITNEEERHELKKCYGSLIHNQRPFATICQINDRFFRFNGWNSSNEEQQGICAIWCEEITDIIDHGRNHFPYLHKLQYEHGYYQTAIHNLNHPIWVLSNDLEVLYEKNNNKDLPFTTIKQVAGRALLQKESVQQIEKRVHHLITINATPSTDGKLITVSAIKTEIKTETKEVKIKNC